MRAIVSEKRMIELGYRKVLSVNNDRGNLFKWIAGDKTSEGLPNELNSQKNGDAIIDTLSDMTAFKTKLI